MILSTIAEKLKRRSKGDFKGRHFGASLILQAVSWYLRYSLSYRDIEELLLLYDDRAVLCRMVLPYIQTIPAPTDSRRHARPRTTSKQGKRTGCESYSAPAGIADRPV